MSLPHKQYVLTIVSGNREMLFGLFMGDKFLTRWRLENRIGRTVDEYASWFLKMLNNHVVAPADIREVVIANMIPPLERPLIKLFKEYFNIRPLMVGKGVKTGLNFSVVKGEFLAADRVANLVAAYKMYKDAVIVIDFGLITKVDVISATGVYLGGSLLPGVLLSLDTCANFAPYIPQVGFKAKPDVLGNNAETAVQSGAYWSTVHMLNNMMTQIRNQHKITGPVIGTGSFAQELVDDVHFDDINNELTLLGLKEIAEKQ